MCGVLFSEGRLVVEIESLKKLFSGPACHEGSLTIFKTDKRSKEILIVGCRACDSPQMNFSREELEMLEISVEQRLIRFRNTARYFRNETVVGEMEECSDLREAMWQVIRYLELHEKLLKNLKLISG
jgi:hypothetical protein